jgi:hypothetical protein
MGGRIFGVKYLKYTVFNAIAAKYRDGDGEKLLRLSAREVGAFDDAEVSTHFWPPDAKR